MEQGEDERLPGPVAHVQKWLGSTDTKASLNRIVRKHCKNGRQKVTKQRVTQPDK